MSDSADNVITSHALDLEPIWSGSGTFAEMEATNIQAVLGAAGIEAVINGSAQLPSVPFEVLVRRDQMIEARKVIAEALASGPAAAEEAERAGELPSV